MNDATRELGAALGIAVLGSIAASRYASSIAPALHGLSPANQAEREHLDRRRAARRVDAARRRGRRAHVRPRSTRSSCGIHLAVIVGARARPHQRGHRVPQAAPLAHPVRRPARHDRGARGGRGHGPRRRPARLRRRPARREPRARPGPRTPPPARTRPTRNAPRKAGRLLRTCEISGGFRSWASGPSMFPEWQLPASRRAPPQRNRSLRPRPKPRPPASGPGSGPARTSTPARAVPPGVARADARVTTAAVVGS